MSDYLRAYFFNNMYLTGIHAGIQAQHATAEMFNKYRRECSDQEHLLQWWASDYKTTIILNGGYAANLMMIENIFETEENPYPWATFHESMDALGGCITSVGIILPEKVFDFKSEKSKFLLGRSELNHFPSDAEIQKQIGLTDYEMVLAETVSRYRLMT